MDITSKLQVFCQEHYHVFGLPTSGGRAERRVERPHAVEAWDRRFENVTHNIS